MDHNKALFERG
ncbi:hypothetical protein LINGRAHAP2_LOCUS22351 [Linum grandiflorum]